MSTVNHQHVFLWRTFITININIVSDQRTLPGSTRVTDPIPSHLGVKVDRVSLDNLFVQMYRIFFFFSAQI